jgi:hypothetical protein
VTPVQWTVRGQEFDLAVDDEDVVYRTAGKREAGGWSFRAL